MFQEIQFTRNWRTACRKCILIWRRTWLIAIAKLIKKGIEAKHPKQGILLVSNINNYNQGPPSTEYIQATTDCEYIVLSKTAMEEFSMTIIGWDAIIAKITAKAMLEKVNRISPTMTEDATERYLMFLEWENILL